MRSIQGVGETLVASVVLCTIVATSVSATPNELKLKAVDTDEIALEIEFPTTGSVISDFGCGSFVAGRAFRGGFDIALVLDTSGSTAEPSGADINRNGVIGSRRGVGQNWVPGSRSSDSGDSVLAAEVAAALRLLDDLDARITRVSVISFSGKFEPGSSYFSRGREDRPASIAHLPLTHDFRRVRDALRALRLAGSEGGTDMAAGVRRGFVELSALQGARSERNDENQKLMFFFTDGVLEHQKDFSALLSAARRAHKLGIRVHTFAIGDLAVRLPIAVVQLADMTGGEFTPVVKPGQLSAVVETIEFANLEEISIRSRPLGVNAELVRWAADGSWGGFVKLAAGTNRIEVSARLADGSTVTQSVDVRGNHSEKPASIPNPLRDRYARLRKACLHQVRGDALLTERAADDHDLRKLRLEIEVERTRARKRAAEQRKSLRLEVEEENQTQPEQQ
jgi:hypothetical protein